jgi:uncharacterized membrane protein
MRRHEVIGSIAWSVLTVLTALSGWSAQNALNVTIEGADASLGAQFFILSEN